MDKIDPIITKLGLDGWDNFAPLKDLCTKLRISRPAYLVFALLVVSLAMIVIGLAEQFIVNILGILYPAFQSIKAIQSEGITQNLNFLANSEDDKQWLTYWIVFSLTQIADSTFGFALGFVPFYHLIKLIFLVSLFHPQIQGATKVYDAVKNKTYLFR
jgi:receptor expression-enhancing protein 5/6